VYPAGGLALPRGKSPHRAMIRCLQEMANSLVANPFCSLRKTFTNNFKIKRTCQIYAVNPKTKDYAAQLIDI
jgi:hypothetical protein